MKTMTRILSLFAATIIALSLPGAASGATIGFKLGQNGNGNQQNVGQTNAVAVQPDQLAGAPDYTQTNWNVLGRWGDNTTNSFETNSYALLDSSGNDTHVSINWDATGNWSVQNSGTATDQGTPDGNLMNTYVDSNNGANVALTNSLANGVYGQAGANKPLVYLYGLQQWLATQGAAQYDVVIYMDGDNQAGRTGEYWIQNATGPYTNIIYGADTTTHVFMRDYNNFTANQVYQQVPLSSNNGRVAGAGNYAVFTGLSADSFLIRPAEFNTRCGINAIQIVARTTPVGATIEPLPASQAYAGGTAAFRATVSGVLPFTYQWIKNGTVTLVDGGNISGATTATLKINGVSAADAGNYTLVVSNPGGSVTSSVAPLVVTAPSANSFAEKVVADNAVAFWRFNETASDPAANNASASDYVGGFNATYGTSALNGYNGVVGPQPSDFPGFEAGNSALQTVYSATTPLPYPSSYVSWAVVPPLNLNTNTVTMCAWIYPTAPSQAANASLVFTRGSGSDISGFGYGPIVNNNANNLGYTWNNAAATYNWVSWLIPPTNQWSFVVCAISPTNAILYLCNTNGFFSATNAVTNAVVGFSSPTMIGDDPSSTGTPQNRAFSGAIDEVAIFNRTLSETEIADLYKQGLGLSSIPTVINTQPQPLALMAGRSAKFNVLATGDGTLSYQWRKNNGNLSDGGTISGALSPTLNISAAAVGDAADFDVVVTGAAGPTTSDKAHLTVVPTNATPSAYEAAVHKANPIAFWRMDEIGGLTNAYDYWGGTIATHSSEFIAVGQDGPRPPAFVGMDTTNHAATYDGFSTGTETRTSLLNGRGQFSVIGWFNSPAQLQQNRAGLFGQNDVCEFGFHGTATLEAQTVGVYTPRAGAYLSVTNIMPDQWYLIAAVGSGTNVTLYLVSTNNGVTVLQASATHTAATDYGRSVYPFRIGGGGILDATGNYFTGQIDEVAVFDRALTADELAGLLATAVTGSELAAPIISIQPNTPNTLYAGRTARLSVTAVGLGLNYRWRKDGAPINDAGNVFGTKANTLTITNLVAGNAGNYDVVITNNAGSMTSSNASLSVIVPTPGGFEAAVLAANPRAYYRLNELEDPSTGTALAFDYVGGFNGTYGAAAQNGFNLIAGPLSPEWKFETTNTAMLSTVSTANAWANTAFGSLSTNTVTFAMWIYPMGLQENWSGLLVSRGGTAAGGFSYNDQQMIGYTWNGNSAATYGFASGLVPPANQWSFVAMVVEPAQATLYLGNTNGWSSATNTLAHTSDVFGSWQIGHDNNGGDATRTFNGVIDEVAVFTRSLSRAEIEGLFAAAGGIVPTALNIQKVGNDVVLSWPRGTLLQADEVIGPWTTNNVTSPFTTAPSALKRFYRVIVR